MKAKLTASLISLALCAQAQTTFTGRINVLPYWTHEKTAGASTVTETFSSIYDATHTSGTNGTAAAPQMNAIARATGMLTNSAAAEWDLTAMPNSFGDSVEFWRVNVLAVRAGTVNSNAITWGGSTNGAWWAWAGSTNETVSVRPGGLLLLVAPDATGYPVDTTNRWIRVLNAGTNTVSYELYVAGAE